MSEKTWNTELDKYSGGASKSEGEGHLPAENGILFFDTDIGRQVGFDRVAVHHVVVPRGCRSSSPHSESHEEEFVFVIRGSVDLWLNGYIYPLKEGHAVGFPAGTGIAHTFINNSDQDVELLVAGEKTKSENLCSFPINPELKATCEIWWENPPTHSLGPHKGMPGSVQDQELGDDAPACLVACPDIERGKPFHYPGDNEVFGEGFRITDKVGLKALGIWYEYLPPGRRSAFPHAHTHEEEFVFVIKGKPTLWLDGYVKELNEGEWSAFPSNTGLSHTLINNTDEDVVYLCIGETEEFPDEKIAYPLNALRNAECERKGWLWQGLPTPRGGHIGRSHVPPKDHWRLELCEEGETKSEGFAKLVYSESLERDAHNGGSTNPKFTFFKESLAVEKDGNYVASVDFWVHSPEAETCYIVGLRIDDNIIQQWNDCCAFIEDYIKRALECKRVRTLTSVDATSPWLEVGFQPTGGRNDQGVELEKLL